MLKEANEFDLTLIRYASDFAEMLHAYFRTLVDKNCAPEVLDERVAEKVVAKAVVIFSEDA